MKTGRTQFKGNDVVIYREGQMLKLDTFEVRVFRLHEQVMGNLREYTSDLMAMNPYFDTVGEICRMVDNAEQLADMLDMILRNLTPGTLEYKTMKGAFVAMMNVPKRMDKFLREHPEVVAKKVQTIA